MSLKTPAGKGHQMLACRQSMLGNSRHQRIFQSRAEALQREVWPYRPKPPYCRDEARF